MARKRPRTEVAAAVDIGSFSVHLLVAKVRGHLLEGPHDESAHLGLGRAIDETGGLGEARERLVDDLRLRDARMGHGRGEDHDRRHGPPAPRSRCRSGDLRDLGFDRSRGQRPEPRRGGARRADRGPGRAPRPQGHDRRRRRRRQHGGPGGGPVARTGCGRAAARGDAAHRRARPPRSTDRAGGRRAAGPLAAGDGRGTVAHAEGAHRCRRHGAEPAAGRAAAGKSDAEPPARPALDRPP